MNITIENSFYKAEISSFGAEIVHFTKKDDGTQLIWNGDSSVWKNRAPLLFPFVARCNGGYFMIDGKKCEYTRNHGFARDLDTKVILQEPTKVVFELTDSEDTLYRFPYHFSLQTEYEVTDKGLNWKMTVKNTDNKAFRFGIGTHAAFACPRNTDAAGTLLTDYIVEFENKTPLTKVVVDKDCYLEFDSNGKAPVTAPYGEQQNGFVPLSASGFGNGHLFANNGSKWVGLKNKKTGNILKINTDGFPYVMIWQNTAGSPQFICIEPWYGLPDAVNTDHLWENKVGLQTIESGKTFVSQQNLNFED